MACSGGKWNDPSPTKTVAPEAEERRFAGRARRGRSYTAFGTRQPQASFLQMWPDCYSEHGASVAPWHVGFQFDSSGGGSASSLFRSSRTILLLLLRLHVPPRALVKVVAMNNSASRLIHFAPVPRGYVGCVQFRGKNTMDRNRSGIFLFFLSNSSRKTAIELYTRGKGLFSAFSGFSFLRPTRVMNCNFFQLLDRGYIYTRIGMIETIGRIVRNCWFDERKGVGISIKGRKLSDWMHKYNRL